MERLILNQTIFFSNKTKLWNFNNVPQRSILLQRLILVQCKYFTGIKMKIMSVALLEIKN